jgi:hypothetical protein
MNTQMATLEKRWKENFGGTFLNFHVREKGGVLKVLRWGLEQSDMFTNTS